MMFPAGWQRYLWLLLLLLYLALAVQLTVSGSGIQGHLATHRSLKTAEAAADLELALMPRMARAPDQASTTAKPTLLLNTTAGAATLKPSSVLPGAGRNSSQGTMQRAPFVVENQLTIDIQPPAGPAAPTKVLESIRKSSDPRLYAGLLEKLKQLGTAGSDRRLAAAIGSCAPNHNGRYEPALLYVQSHRYLHRPSHLCHGQVLALIAVHSNAKNLARRAAIRRTWGSLRYIGQHRVDVAFFLGRPASGDSAPSGARGPQLQGLIDDESARYGDIVQLDYTENYRNMTVKHLAVYEWTLAHCPAASYLVKVDDDTFTDVAHLATFLSRGPPPGFYCSATGGAKPQRVRRGPRAKWTVTTAEYPDNAYPPYCEGFGYILQAERVADIYFCSLFKRFFWIDDVHVTGVLATAAKVPLTRFWRGHSYAVMVPSQASEVIMDFIFLTAEQSEFFESIWHKLWYAVLQHSLDINL